MTGGVVILLSKGFTKDLLFASRDITVINTLPQSACADSPLKEGALKAAPRPPSAAFGGGKRGVSRSDGGSENALCRIYTGFTTVILAVEKAK